MSIVQEPTILMAQIYACYTLLAKNEYYKMMLPLRYVVDLKLWKSSCRCTNRSISQSQVVEIIKPMHESQY